jgi:hypothetical protein
MSIEHEKLASPSGEKSLLELTCDANESKDEDTAEVVSGLSLMSLEVTCGGTISTSSWQRYNIFSRRAKFKIRYAN